MTDPAGAQRSYRAPCPSCGAPVEFRSAQSAYAVCSFCHSTVVREGETLKRLGKMAELFDDFSPLQLTTSGRYEQESFTLVGRLQYRYAQGRWTEWVAAFDDGQRFGILSEDNGAYVFALPVDLKSTVPPSSALSVGTAVTVGGQHYTVTARTQAALVSAQGELPHLPPLDQDFLLVELRSAQGQVLSLDYSSDPPTVYLGSSVQLDNLQLHSLRDESTKETPGRAFGCPNCGAAVSVQLESTQSITCPACGSIIDISHGIGGELRHALQDEPVHPLIPLGSIGQFPGKTWQVVGFQQRMGHEPGDDESFLWEEYLLYNKTLGFSFLVDASDGWSLVAPITGVPAMTGSSPTYMRKTFRLDSTYSAQTIYVAGEFYWQVERGQMTANQDFTSGRDILSLESSGNEQVWSYGSKIDGLVVAAAFKLDIKRGDFKRADAAPLTQNSTAVKFISWIIVLIFVLSLLDDCNDSDSSGGYGSYFSGGGHK
jgi:DNA-directed RNA polymerase subunit RPC12/RpoP